MSDISITFLPAIEKELERLGIRKKEDFPKFEEMFLINDEQSFEIPLPITQFLWGYDWEAYELHLTPEGKKIFEFDEDEEPIFIFSTEWTESGSVFWNDRPCLCVGRVLGIKGWDHLLIDVNLRNQEDPSLSFRMPNERHWLGYIGDLSYFLPYTVAEPANGASEEVQKKIDEAFSEVISSFVNALMLDEGDEQEEKIKDFNKLCNQFFAENPTASIASIADGLVQLGIPYGSAIKDVTWARSFGTKNDDSKDNVLKKDVSDNTIVKEDASDNIEDEEDISVSKVVEVFLDSFKYFTEDESETKKQLFKKKCNSFLHKNPRETENLIREIAKNEIDLDYVYQEVTKARGIEYSNMLALIRSENIQGILDYIKKGFPLNICYFGSTCLHSAIEMGKKDIVQLLIENGADPEVKDKDGDVALHTAINWAKADIVELLVSFGVDLNVLNADGFTPITSIANNKSLALALEGNKKTILNILLEKGAGRNL